MFLLITIELTELMLLSTRIDRKRVETDRRGQTYSVLSTSKPLNQ